MSIFGNIGGMLGNLIEQHGGAEALLSQAVTQMGGVQGVVSKLQQAGLGDQVKSWLGTGPNQPVTPQAIGDALGHGQIGQLAARFGVPADQLSGLIAGALPGLIDRISPHGTLQPQMMQGADTRPAPLDPAS